MKTVLHEITHVLGFNNNKFSVFVPPSGGTVLTNSMITAPSVIAWVRITSFLIIRPKRTMVALQLREFLWKMEAQQEQREAIGKKGLFFPSIWWERPVDTQRFQCSLWPC